MEEHRHHPHFDAANLMRMEERRRSLLPPEEVLAELLPAGGGEEGVLADIGSGAGFFTVPAARRLGRGKVYAVDRQPDLLAFVAERARQAGLSNVETVLADATDLPIGDGRVDFVLMAHVFHDIEGRGEALDEVRRILRPDGRFCLLEWEKVPTEFGPPLEIRIASADLRAIIREGGFAVERLIEGPGPFYRLHARKL